MPEISIAAVKPMAFIVAVPFKRKAFKTHIRQHLSKIKYTESGIQQSLCFATFPGEICLNWYEKIDVKTFFFCIVMIHCN